MPKNTCKCLLELACFAVFPSTCYVRACILYDCLLLILLLRVLNLDGNRSVLENIKPILYLAFTLA